MRISRRLLALAAAVLAATPTAQAARPSPQPRIVNGAFTSQQPTVAAILKGISPDTAAQWCTATLIGCQTVLTAAHCVCDAEGAACQPDGAQPPQPNRYFVFLQHAGTFAVDRIAVHPSYAADVADIAVLHLAAPVTGIAPTPINRTSAPPHGMTGAIVGFGRQGGPVSDYGLKRAGNVAIAGCPSGVSNDTSVCWNFAAPAGPAGSNSNTCHGDSGGPLFVDFGCGPVVAGVTTDGVNADCTIGDHSWDANVFAFTSFIDAVAPGELGQDHCGPGRQVGDPSVNVNSQVATLSSNLPDDTLTIPVAANTAELRVTLNGVDTPSVFENFDLYVRFGAAPTTTQYDCRSNGSNQFGECLIPLPTAGTWYAVAHRISGTGTAQLTATTFPVGPAGTGPVAPSCDDGSTCTTRDTCQAGQCIGTPAPRTTCHQPAGTARSRLVVRNMANDRRDAMKWTATQLEVRDSDLGDPATTAYEVCVFDQQSGTPRLALDARVPPGSGWQRTARSLTFRDHAASNGGIRALRLKTGATNGSIHLRGAGLNLSTPQLPLDPRVIIQVGNADACWEADFSRTQRNRLRQFRARSD